MITFSAFADEVSHDFREQLRFLVSRDIGYIELRFVNGKNLLDLSPQELSETRQMLDDYGIKVSAIASPVGKIRINEPFGPHLDRFIHAVYLASFFETTMVRVFSYYAPMGDQIDHYRTEVLGRMSRKAEILKDTGIMMVHENESGIYGHTALNCLDIAESINSPNLRLVYDPANFVWGEGITDPMDSCWPLMKPYVVHIHVKDWKLGSTDTGCVPGEGDGQIAGLLSELVKTGYTGFITLEPHLNRGGQFGGETTPVQFDLAIQKVRDILEFNNHNR